MGAFAWLHTCWREMKSDKEKALRRKTLAKDAVIFREGERGIFAYLLKSGKVAITVSRDGEPVLLTTILPNQIFGELALIDNSPRSATAIAMEPSEVILITQDDIDRQLESGEEFMKYWVAYLTDRIRDLSKRVRD